MAAAIPVNVSGSRKSLTGNLVPILRRILAFGWREVKLQDGEFLFVRSIDKGEAMIENEGSKYVLRKPDQRNPDRAEGRSCGAGDHLFVKEDGTIQLSWLPYPLVNPHGKDWAYISLNTEPGAKLHHLSKFQLIQ